MLTGVKEHTPLQADELEHDGGRGKETEGMRSTADKKRRDLTERKIYI